MEEIMLINATQPEELRVALIKDNLLIDLDIEKPGTSKNKANIYKGYVRRIEPSLEAAFVEYGTKRQGFLPLKEISPQCYAQPVAHNKRPKIEEVIKLNQQIMVQIDKEERGTKGAALTTYISLAGCYLVLMPNNPSSGGISRRIEGEDRDALRNILKELPTPENMGLIIRTSGVGKSLEDLRWDLNALLNQWEAIKQAYTKQPAPFLIHQEGDIITRAIRDNLRKSVGKIIVDHQETYVKVKNYIEQVNPDFLNNIQLYNDALPLFSRYHIESQIETAHQRQVLLPSGGSVVIDHTEALISIDINSARAKSGTNIETTALTTNLEAADEIARQLRLRDLGGLIVIDFIDMSSSQHQRDIENQLSEALHSDRARVQVGKISRFGLLEMSRQRIRLSLGESSHETCPRCEGQGTIRKTSSLIFAILRLIEENTLEENVQQVQVQLPVPIATYVLNEKRKAIIDIEKTHNVTVMILPNPHLEVPHYKIKRILQEKPGGKTASYKIVQPPELSAVKQAIIPQKEEPAIKSTLLSSRKKKSNGLLAYLKRLFCPSKKTDTPPEKKSSETQSSSPTDARTSKSPQRSQRRRRGAYETRTGRRNQPYKKRPPRD